MSRSFDKTEFDHLIATRQFYPAVWRVIDCDDYDDEERVAKVTELVGQAIRSCSTEPLGKIMKQFERWVDPDMRIDAYACLNETTAVDPHPDEP